MKSNFKVNKYLTNENVQKYFNNENTAKQMESKLTIFNVYDLETCNTNGARPYCVSFYKLSKIASKYNRDLTPEEHQN